MKISARTYLKLTSLSLLASALFLIPLISAYADSSPVRDIRSLKIAAVINTGPEQPWDYAFLDAWRKVRQERPFGLEINEPVYTERAFGEVAEAAMRLYARQGYDIIWANSAFSDQARRLMKIYPDILFVVAGSGNEPHGGNLYWVYNSYHEPAYLLGMTAGLLTKTDIVSAVGAYPASESISTINAFYLGAKSVNDKIRIKISYIDSWWNPPLAYEATKAQIASGSDQVLQLANSFEACEPGVAKCYGTLRDWYDMAPGAIPSSIVLDVRSNFRWIVSEWYRTKTMGKPFSGNTERHLISMAEGGSDIAPIRDVPESIRARVLAAREQIISGELGVPYDLTERDSD